MVAIDWPFFAQYFPLIISAMWTTVELFAASMVIGTIGGLLLALMRLARNPVIWGTAWLLSWILRGVPLLVILFFTFFGLPVIGITLSPMGAAILGMGIDTAAYKGEIIRAGIISVDHGQYEAARALGMTPSYYMRRIILPQAIHVIIPPYVTNAITVLKSTSIAGVITVAEMTGVANRIISATFKPIETLVMVGLIYLALNTVLAVAQQGLERAFAVKR